AQPRATRHDRQSDQEIRERVASKALLNELHEAPRLHVSKGALADAVPFAAELDEMRTSGPANRIRELQTVRCTFLRVVVLVPQRRITRDGNEAEPRVSRVGGQ